MKVYWFLFLVILLISPAGFAQSKFGYGPNPEEGFYPEAHRFVFFAVLEGCFTDGLIEEDLDWILSADENGVRDGFANFIISCPLCGPAGDAFELYAERKISSKQIIKRSSYRTFGPGLEDEVKAELAKGGQSLRDALQKLVGKWIEERIKAARLTDAEEATLRKELAEMRKEGEKALKRMQQGGHGDRLRELYKDWETCPTCSGAAPMAGVEE
ncbi:MAG: hypothetical protein P1U87_01730 [Verrucomicrobiales bacterium]|nr:hypothetical protein [Verrucomicrobiales bacterium]